MTQNNRELNLNFLDKGMLGVTPAIGSVFKEACIVRLGDQGHSNGVALELEENLKKYFH